MTLNTIRKTFFTNRLAEQLFIGATRARILKVLVSKLLPGNELYPKGTNRDTTRNGIRYQLDINDYQAWSLYFMVDSDSSVSILSHLGDAKSIMDIGGNLGQTALRISRNRNLMGIKSSIICFEPFPDNHDKLLKNLSINAYDNITVEKIALGEEVKKVEMFKDCETNSGGNRIVNSSTAQASDKESVQVTTLDAYMDSKSITELDFIKIDVEGYEYAALKGAEKTLIKFKPRLFIELDDVNLKEQGASAKILLDYLIKLGYSISDVQGLHSFEELMELAIHTDIYCE